MIVQSANIELASSRYYREEQSIEEKIRFWVETPPQNRSETQPVFPGDIVDISPEAIKTCEARDEESGFNLNLEDKLKIKLIQALLEGLTGKKIRFFIPKEIDTKAKTLPANPAIQIQKPAVRQQAGWGLQYDYCESYRESEQSSITASGTVKTADGREIKLQLQVNMSREFKYQNNIHLRAGDAKAVDPLVINFNAPAAELSEKAYIFDLDADGNKDTISFVKGGSGFLAWDRNGDGIINNGSELFGLQTGDGFLELAEYDQDGNGWIDENDPIYANLLIWCKDNEGNDNLLAIGQKGIGAIYLGRIDSSFNINNSDNQQLGVVRSTGIFLREDGTAGSIQQVDLII